MCELVQCPRCGEAGPATLVVIGDHRVGVCANQHKMTEEPIGSEPIRTVPLAHRRMTDWLRTLERGGRAPY